MDYKNPGLLREYVASLKDDDVKFLLMRLDQRFTGDVADAVLFLQHHDGIDSWLKTARTVNEFYHLLDVAQGQLEFENKRRSW